MAKTAKKRTKRVAPRRPLDNTPSLPSQEVVVVSERGRGRPTSITSEMISKAESAAKLGLDWETVSKYAGISEASFYLYKRQGQIDIANGVESIYSDFTRTLQNAKAEWEVSNIARITKAAIGGAEIQESTETYGRDKEGNEVLKSRIITRRQTPPQWTASAWILERREPEKYGRRIEFDWRKPAVRSGLDPDSIKGRVVGLILEAIAEGDRQSNNGSDGGSPSSESGGLSEILQISDET